MRKSVCAVFDIGKTNKKAFLIDEAYRIEWEQSVSLPEAVDEDGDTCENLDALSRWIAECWQQMLSVDDTLVKGLNFSAYGASFVLIGPEGKPLTPLYNYLKPYPEHLSAQFYETYGGEETLALRLASPILGSLNSGMQLYRFKHQRAQLFDQVSYCLHLPQYLSYLFGGEPCTDITSIGCHTNLWDFGTQQYHHWVEAEGILPKLPALRPCGSTTPLEHIAVGTGLHDSSSALIPYLIHFNEPFVLLSTGTWNIALNPFNDTPLSFEELQHDCLSYLSYEGRPIKAARLFAGNFHEQQTQQIAFQFGVEPHFYKQITLETLSGIGTLAEQYDSEAPVLRPLDFQAFGSCTEAYLALMHEIVRSQIKSLRWVLNNSTTKRIFVDGGFGHNAIFMQLMAKAFAGMEVYAAEIAQASALGAALAIHAHWNSQPYPNQLITLKKYT